MQRLELKGYFNSSPVAHADQHHSTVAKKMNMRAEGAINRTAVVVSAEVRWLNSPLSRHVSMNLQKSRPN